MPMFPLTCRIAAFPASAPPPPQSHLCWVQVTRASGIAADTLPPWHCSVLGLGPCPPVGPRGHCTGSVCPSRLLNTVPAGGSTKSDPHSVEALLCSSLKDGVRRKQEKLCPMLGDSRHILGWVPQKSPERVSWGRHRAE